MYQIGKYKHQFDLPHKHKHSLGAKVGVLIKNHIFLAGVTQARQLLLDLFPKRQKQILKSK
jgi:hypothetical protein